MMKYSKGLTILLTLFSIAVFSNSIFAQSKQIDGAAKNISKQLVKDTGKISETVAVMPF